MILYLIFNKEGPYVVAEQDLSIANGQASLPLNNLKGDSAYYAVIAPATSQGDRYRNRKRNNCSDETYNIAGHSGIASVFNCFYIAFQYCLNP